VSGTSRGPISLSVTEASRPKSTGGGGDWAKTLRKVTGENQSSEGMSDSAELGGGRPLSAVIKEETPAKEDVVRRVTVSILGIRNLPEDVAVESYSGGGALGKEEVFCKLDLHGEKTKTTRGIPAYPEPGKDGTVKFPHRETVYYLAGSDVSDLTINVSARRVLAGVNGPEWSVGDAKLQQLGKRLYEDRSSTLWLPLSPSPGGPLDEDARYSLGRDKEPVVIPEVRFEPVNGTQKCVVAYSVLGIARVCARTESRSQDLKILYNTCVTDS
jgi:hypothetical protein